ncbi:SDR family NAD(P)-dependent oxidoreductase [Streptomyces sp. BPTC-684]|uniref:SDR family NAD(P)-dependent oxidoreductase n=1 Tax=Streptomyces sp. BPTC-684 TaxID=3043734 RepID=UPI0024B18927|nr:SDR family NAD(P)-dependent oxidoreductase [Streptomyces sp. BPTC-684]WHM41060.1 SDR family NAD(P)-dependent oxidoreductase [Streptomyces sp. BPTC-684]
MAECFVRADLRVALNGRNPERLSEASAHLRDLGGQVLELPGDAGDEPPVRGALDRVADLWGGVDVVVDNAGVGGCTAPPCGARRWTSGGTGSASTSAPP